MYLVFQLQSHFSVAQWNATLLHPLDSAAWFPPFPPTTVGDGMLFDGSWELYVWSLFCLMLKHGFLLNAIINHTRSIMGNYKLRLVDGYTYLKFSFGHYFPQYLSNFWIFNFLFLPDTLFTWDPEALLVIPFLKPRQLKATKSKSTYIIFCFLMDKILSAASMYIIYVCAYLFS